MRKPTNRAGAVEGVSLRFSFERPRPPLKPFLATYVGDDVAQVDGVGLFQNGTTAEVDREVAAKLRGQPDWFVRERPRPPADDDAGQAADGGPIE